MAEQQQAAADRAAASRERVAATSGDVLAAQVAKLAELFPEAVVEGRVDFDKLKATLGGAAESGPGRFSFTWAGKDDAVALLQTPSRGTLVPCPDQSVDFDTTANAFVEGDNLEVLKLLFKPYFGRVKLIYIDPPYNTGQDFVYPDDFADPLKNYLVQTGQVDDAGNLLSNKVDRAGRVHSGWLSMMYPRLFLARQLLRDDGVIWVSIDDHEVHHLRMVMDEIFGAENFVGCVVRATGQTTSQDSSGFGTSFDYVLVYSRGEEFRLGGLPFSKKDMSRFSGEDESGKYCTWQMRKTGNNDRRDDRPNLYYAIKDPDGQDVLPIGPGSYESCWRFGRESYARLVKDGLIEWKRTHKDGVDAWWPYVKQYLNEGTKTPSPLWNDLDGSKKATIDLKELLGAKLFDTPKPVDMLKRIIQLSTSADESELVLDFFSGSGTTAQAVVDLNAEDGGNRRFLIIQLPEPTAGEYRTISELGQERVKRVLTRHRNDGVSRLRQTASDFGLKVFKLSEPAIRPWSAGDADRDPDVYAERLSFYNDPLSPEARPNDVVWEVALRYGYSLATTMNRRELTNGNVVWNVVDPVTGRKMWVCLDATVRADLSKQLDLTPDTLLVCRDVALDDTAAANLALQCRLKTI